MQSDAPRIVVSVTGGIGHLRLDRPEKRNAIDARMVAEVRVALERFASDGVPAVVLEASGEAFCAGGDRAEAGTGVRSATDLALALVAAPVFLAARVHGATVGGGVALAAVCPLVVCTPQAWFDLPEARSGFLPTPVLAFLEPALGPRRALDACLFPERLSAERAVEVSLATSVIPAAEIDAHIEAQLRPFVANPRLARSAASAWQSLFQTDAFRERFAKLMALLD